MKEVTLQLDDRTYERMRVYAKRYRTHVAGMFAIVAAYYFGDGKDHLRCEHCVFGSGDTCALPDFGEQMTTLPILDKGSVVVGLPTVEQGI